MRTGHRLREGARPGNYAGQPGSRQHDVTQNVYGKSGELESRWCDLSKFVRDEERSGRFGHWFLDRYRRGTLSHQLGDAMFDITVLGQVRAGAVVHFRQNHSVNRIALGKIRIKMATELALAYIASVPTVRCPMEIVH
jgi:hypothetical protein